MSGVEVRRSNQTTIRVEVQGYDRNKLTVDLLLWFAREAQQAVDLGMPIRTEVKIAARLHLTLPTLKKHLWRHGQLALLGRHA